MNLVEGDATKVTKVGAGLDSALKDKIVEFLQQNLDIFTWIHEDMLSIDNKVIEHKLNVDPTKSPSSRSDEYLFLKGTRLLWKKWKSF